MRDKHHHQADISNRDSALPTTFCAFLIFDGNAGDKARFSAYYTFNSFARDDYRAAADLLDMLTQHKFLPGISLAHLRHAERLPALSCRV